MSLWKPASVTEEPEVVLCNWSILEVTFKDSPDEKSRHFVGTNVTEGYTGRVSSAIVEFDADNMTGKTRSGRVYKLLGAPGVSGNGSYVWNFWAERNGVTAFEDVSAQYWIDSLPEEV